MATIERYEDIQGWQKARELTNFVYAITKQKTFARDFGLKDQIRRAAVSVMSNVAEGFERGGRREFTSFSPTPKPRPVRCAVPIVHCSRPEIHHAGAIRQRLQVVRRDNASHRWLYRLLAENTHQRLKVQVVSSCEL